MKKQSAGLLVYRIKDDQLEVLVGKMGGPWFAKKEIGAWSIPKGEYDEGEDPKTVASREFKEELSKEVPLGEWLELGFIEQKNKQVVAWAVEGDVDVSNTKSNTFKVEWPPRSGKVQEFPEIERVEWKSLKDASAKVIAGQAELLERLANKLGYTPQIEAEQGSLF